MQSRHEQAIDEVSQDTVIEAGFTDEASRLLVRSFEEYIAEHKDEITALEIIYSIPHRRGTAESSTSYGYGSSRRALTFDTLKQLSEVLSQPPRSWTTETLWRAYAQLERDRVRGAGTKRVLTDLVSLVRHAVQLDDELVPYPERVERRYAEWLAAQEAEERRFTPDQRWWLDQVATHIGVNLEIHAEDFNYGEFFNRGGQVAALRAFGPQLKGLLDELNERLNVDRLEG
jgi:type I restriction enzyme R subunit